MITFGEVFLAIMVFWIVGSFVAGFFWAIGVGRYKRQYGSQSAIRQRHPSVMRNMTRCPKCGRRFSPGDTVQSIAAHAQLYHRHVPIGPEDREDWS